MGWLLAMAAACGADAVVVADGRSVGGEPLEVRIEAGRITEVGRQVERGEARVIDAGGRVLLPGFVDSHVHLAYLPDAAGLAAGGVAAAVDLAAPLAALGSEGPVQVLWSGPRVTAPGGYPTRSWGAGGYGLECSDAAACAAAVERLVAAGAGVIKVPLDSGPTLPDASLQAVVATAHGAGIKVVAHALGDADAARAARLGVDALAHLPTEPLAEATVQAWSGKAVISTGGAFGGAAVDNARRLHAAGATLLYGTDFGNTQVRGIDGAELGRLVQAGLTPAEVLAAATTAPAAYWGLADVGALRVGAVGMVVVVDGDPSVDPTVAGRPHDVIRP